MEQRDLLKDQIEQLGKVLGKILANFLELKFEGKAAQGIEISNDLLESELDINIEKLVVLDKSGLNEYLKTYKLTDVHLETLSEYLIEIGKLKTTAVDMEIYFKMGITLLQYADEYSKTVSFERINRINEIESMLKTR